MESKFCKRYNFIILTRYTMSSIETIKIEKVYKTIPTILAKENKKFKYVEIEKKLTNETMKALLIGLYQVI